MSTQSSSVSPSREPTPTPTPIPPTPTPTPVPEIYGEYELVEWVGPPYWTAWYKTGKTSTNEGGFLYYHWQRDRYTTALFRSTSNYGNVREERRLLMVQSEYTVRLEGFTP